MTHDCRLGFPAALAHTEPDDVRVRRTPERVACPRETTEEWVFRKFDRCVWIDGKAVDITEADCRQIKGAAQREPDSASSDTGTKPAAVLPSTSAAPVFRDGWIEWTGELWERGDKFIGPPVAASTRVEVRFNDGTEDSSERAGSWNWGRFEFVGGRQIIAYRLVR